MKVRAETIPESIALVTGEDGEDIGGRRTISSLRMKTWVRYNSKYNYKRKLYLWLSLSRFTWVRYFELRIEINEVLALAEGMSDTWIRRKLSFISELELSIYSTRRRTPA